jgi:hypothetical protein
MALLFFCPVSRIPYQGQCILNKIIDVVGRMKTVQYSSIRFIKNQSSIFCQCLIYGIALPTVCEFCPVFRIPDQSHGSCLRLYRYMVGRMKDAQYYTLPIRLRTTLTRWLMSDKLHGMALYTLFCPLSYSGTRCRDRRVIMAHKSISKVGFAL